MQDTISNLSINEKYTFDSFVQGSSNRLAVACGLTIANNYEPKYNPLLIYGWHGSGKTHLLKAIIYEARTKHSRKNVVYITMECLVKKLLMALRKDDLDRFHQSCRSNELMAIDDIHLIKNKTNTQEMIKGLLDEMMGNKQQIVISSNCSPENMDGFSDSIKSQFSSGTMVDIYTDIKLMKEIAVRKFEEQGIELTPYNMQIIDYIVSGYDYGEDVCRLLGVINTIINISRMGKTPITIDLARMAIEDIMGYQGCDLFTFNKYEETERIRRVLNENIALLDNCGQKA